MKTAGLTDERLFTIERRLQRQHITADTEMGRLSCIMGVHGRPLTRVSDDVQTSATSRHSHQRLNSHSWPVFGTRTCGGCRHLEGLMMTAAGSY